MIRIKKTDTICWWCGSLANSREHKYKKTDVINNFGKRSQSLNDKTVLVRDDKLYNIQGANSDYLKFNNVLCQKCNNEKSQPADQAYETFINYINSNLSSIIEAESLDFSKIFSDCIIKQKHNVFRYFIKNFCCRLATNNITINPELIRFLDGENKLNYFFIKFEISMDLLWFQERLIRDNIGSRSLYFGPLSYKQNKNTNFEIVYSFFNYGCFRTYFYYSESITEKMIPSYDEYNLSEQMQLNIVTALEKDNYENLSDQELIDLVNNWQ
ncbi:MAG: hypothetical protein IPM95_09535 [Sphingobacteriales bacterium]|nr:hypothetical protein [Sphingobacteriales bacterium]